MKSLIKIKTTGSPSTIVHEFKFDTVKEGRKKLASLKRELTEGREFGDIPHYLRGAKNVELTNANGNELDSFFTE
jgi:hypothetical protein